MVTKAKNFKEILMLKRRRPRLAKNNSSWRRRKRIRRSRLAARQRRAESAIEALVDVTAYVDTVDVLDKDEQSVELLNKVYEYFYNKFELTRNELEAFNRMRSVIENGDRWGLSLMRNNIFKAAHALGMKLPSHMF